MNKNRESKDNLMKKVKMNKLDIPSSNLIIDKGKKPRHNQHLTQQLTSIPCLPLTM